MLEKMTIEQFQTIKKQLSQLVEDFKAYYGTHSNDKDFDDEKVVQEFSIQYFNIQKNLFNYDLSDIPFESWQGMSILDNAGFVDFSKTRANIDFSLVEYLGDINYVNNANFKGCNIRNLDKVRYINPNNYDEQTIKNNSNIFLSDLFDEDFKKKYYTYTITIDDIATLSQEQISELQTKKELKLHYESRHLMEEIGINKSLELCKSSSTDFKIVMKLINNFFHGDYHYRFWQIFDMEDFKEKIEAADINEIKKICYAVLRKIILDTGSYNLDINSIPEIIKKENPDIFLTNDTVSDEFRMKYYSRELNIDDVMNNIDLFKDIPIENFLAGGEEIYYIREISEIMGQGNLQLLLKNYPEQMNYIIKGNILRDFYYECCNIFHQENEDPILKKFDDTFTNFFKRNNTIMNREQLLLYKPSLFQVNYLQQKVFDTFGLENIRRFEYETEFFSHKRSKYSPELEMFSAIMYFIRNKINDSSYTKNTELSYEEFQNKIAIILNNMKKSNVFTDFPDYDWMQGEFRTNHPEIFIDSSAPPELKEAFYKNKITPDFLREHKEYIKYLTDKKLSDIIKTQINLIYKIEEINSAKVLPYYSDFIEEYASRYGNEKLLQLIAKYGDIISYETISSLNNEIEDEQIIEKSLRESIHNKIILSTAEYSYLSDVPEMVTEYPEIFVNFDNLINISPEERERLTKAFYSRRLSFDDIKKYPELINNLKDKNLFIAFGTKARTNNPNYLRPLNSKYPYSDLELLKAFGNEKFLELCSKYGRYMNDIATELGVDVDFNQGNLDFDAITQKIEDIIVRESIAGNLAYSPDDAPDFLKKSNPELFLSDDAPEELKKYFYNYGNNYPMSFEVLQKNKDWLPFLKGKALVTSLLRINYLKEDMIKYLEAFGEEKAIKLGINRAETVREMMSAHQVDLMKSWYDKTGGKFIPDFVVMQNFRLEDADKFLTSGSNWSTLMRIQSFAETPEARDAMLKLAYSFGAFDQDQRGFKKLQDLLTRLPKKIDADKGYIIDRIDHDLNDKIAFEISTFLGEYTITDFEILNILKEEKVNIDFTKNIFSQIYKKQNDGSYSLAINQQSCPKSAQTIRNILENFRELPILNPDKAHQLFGGFELKYDAEFREFLLANIEKIIENQEYTSLISNIQRQFSDIKAINSNRTLTLELAISYVQSNRYTSINTGNERVAEISAIAGYSQTDFNTLQQIYNYGKQRTFSSIPKIEEKVEKTSGRYTYETLRLDDPLAMAIGTLTDCCQELNNCAEVCMEHSMVDKNGRIFVIKDEQGNIVAQSWVWRNKDVLCFDNIEIPLKAFVRAEKANPDLGRRGFTDEVFEIYKQAAHDLIEADEKVYKELLESGKITQEQYEGLRLGKVTVGLGYNDIAESLKQNSQVDKGTVSKPLPFEEPVKLTRGLYTSDSFTQYILEERKDRKNYEGDTLPVHSDTYIEYTDDNFTEKSLLSLEKLEIVTKENPIYLEISVGNYTDSEHLVTKIARIYDLNPETTRIVMNPNFAIIYDTNDNKVKIGDLFFNTRVDNEQQQMDIESKVILQIRLALEQIAGDKEIDISNLNTKQLEMYKKVINLTNEIDIERGVGHAR